MSFIEFIFINILYNTHTGPERIVIRARHLRYFIEYIKSEERSPPQPP